MRRWVVPWLVAFVVLAAGVGVLGAQSADDYALSSDSSVEIPTREVAYDDTTFEIDRVGKADPGSTFTVTATAPQDSDYLVYVVDKEERVRQSNRGTGTEEVPLDLGRLDPGTYAVTIEQNGTVAAMPLVVRGYEVSQDVPAETAADTETTVSITLDQVADGGTVERVVLTVWDGARERTVTATRESQGEYTATIPAGELESGTYNVVARAETSETAFGRNELIGISDGASLSVTEGSTPTETESDGGTNGGTQPSSGTDETAGGETAGDDTATPTPTTSATPTSTVTTSTPTTTLTQTPTPTETPTPTPTPADSSTSETTTASDTATPTVAESTDTDDGGGAVPTTDAAGGAYTTVVYAVVLGVLVGVLAAKRRQP